MSRWAQSVHKRYQAILWARMCPKCDAKMMTATEGNLAVSLVSTSAASMHPTRLERVTYSSIVLGSLAPFCTDLLSLDTVLPR